MAAYRFCRTDDITLLVDALNRCWLPYVPGEPPMTPVAFKRSIRDLQVWCSSCMVAFAGADPIGVLIGAKRPGGTLVHMIAVHPDHRRLGHARHLLASLGSKLAILGPPRIIAEVPESLVPACGLFSVSGYVEETLLTDYELAPGDLRGDADDDRFVIPISLDDLIANGLLGGGTDVPVCWTRSIETLTARKSDLAGLAVATDERIEAYVLYRLLGSPDASANATATTTVVVNATANATATAKDTVTTTAARVAAAAANADAGASVDAYVEIVSLRGYVEDGGARLRHLLARLRGRPIRFAKVHPGETVAPLLEALGFRATGTHVRYAATARAD